MDVAERIKEAIKAGEILKIIYRGGSQPGTWREISPLAVEDGVLTARCFNANSIKRFYLDSVEIATEQMIAAATPWTPAPAQEQVDVRYGSLSEFMALEGSSLLSLGWHVEQSEDSVSLHSRFKNGKLRKGCDAALMYEPTHYNEQVGEDGVLRRVDERPRKRPWWVNGPEMHEELASLTEAADLFMSLAVRLAPNRA